MKNSIYVFLCFVMFFPFYGCKNSWSDLVDEVLNSKEIEQGYGKPRTTFYTCLFSDRDPRIPIVNPVEMYKDEELGWTLRTIELNGDDACGDYHQIDLMFGDSLNLYFHKKEISYSVNGMSFNDSEQWFLVQLLEKKLVVFSEKEFFLQKVGNEIFEKMMPPDMYYERFCEDANLLPWIPDK